MSKKDYKKTNPLTHGIGFSWNVLKSLIVVLLFIAGIIAATQDFAYAMNGDHRVVNYPLFKFFGYDVYNPVFFVLSFFKYFGYEGFQPYYWHALMYFLTFTGIAFFIAVIWTIITAVILKAKGTQNGTARLANRNDLYKNGFFIEKAHRKK